MLGLKMPAAMLAASMIAIACATAGVTNREATATADIRDAQGRTVAAATLVQDGDEVEISIDVAALPSGTHGIHLHTTGTCTPPDFTSAGGHFSPATRRHGFENPEGPHAGDLPNIDVAADGTGRFLLANDRVTLTSGAASLFDADGTAIVIHAGPDDYRTDPAGDSGARIACGVITR
jgi:Cu-Zn family superoxide dismutase